MVTFKKIERYSQVSSQIIRIMRKSALHQEQTGNDKRTENDQCNGRANPRQVSDTRKPSN